MALHGIPSLHYNASMDCEYIKMKWEKEEDPRIEKLWQTGKYGNPKLALRMGWYDPEDLK